MSPGRELWLQSPSSTNAGTGIRPPLTWMAFSVKSPPFGWVLILRLNVLEGNWEVNEVEIEVLNVPQFELVLGHLFGLLMTYQ